VTAKYILSQIHVTHLIKIDTEEMKSRKMWNHSGKLKLVLRLRVTELY
jgi:hypothetical protein